MDFKIKVTIDEAGMKNLDGFINNFLDKCGNVLVDEAKRIAPVDTGKLRDSIEIKDTDYTEKKVTVGSDVEYAIYQELGTVKMRPNAYLRPSLDNIVVLLGSI